MPNLKTMLTDLVTAATPRGFEAHSDRSKIMSNQPRTRSCSVNVSGMGNDVLPHIETIKYLSQTTTFHDAPTIEIARRFQAGRTCFTTHRQEIMSRHSPRKHRLWLYVGTVTPTMLYGAEIWTFAQTIQTKFTPNAEVHD